MEKLRIASDKMEREAAGGSEKLRNSIGEDRTQRPAGNHYVNQGLLSVDHYVGIDWHSEGGSTIESSDRNSIISVLGIGLRLA